MEKFLIMASFVLWILGFANPPLAQASPFASLQKSYSHHEEVISGLAEDLKTVPLEILAQKVTQGTYDKKDVFAALELTDGTVLAISGLILPTPWFNLGDTPEERQMTSLADGASVTFVSEWPHRRA